MGEIIDVNEKIISTWLTHHNYFVMVNIYSGQFHLDIDLLAVNLTMKELLDIEVKVQTGITKISDNDNKQNGFRHFVGQLKSVERENKINEIIGYSEEFKIRKDIYYIKSLLGKKNTNMWLDKLFHEEIEVKFIEEIISELEEHAKGLPLSKNEVIQILKLQNRKKLMIRAMYFTVLMLQNGKR